MYMESLYFDAFAMFMNQITYNITISLSKACLIVFFSYASSSTLYPCE